MSKRSLALALVLFVALVPAAFAKAKSKLELTIKAGDGQPVAAAAITLTATSGEAFSATGVTDDKGKYKTELPDFDRVYQLEIRKEGYQARKETLDFPAQGLKAGATAEVEVPLLVRGPVEVYNEGVLAIQAKDLATAAARFEESTAMKPDFKEAWRVLSMVYLEEKKNDQALAAADKALAIDPVDPVALRNRYEALAALGRREETETALSTLAQHDKSPEVGKLLYNAGADAWNAKNAGVARKHFEEAILVDPKLYQAHSALAEIAIAEKNWDLALAELDQVIAITPRNFKAIERKVHVLEESGKDTAQADALKAQLFAAGISVVSPGSFRRIQIGMTLEEVNRIVGFPGTETARSGAGSGMAVSYLWRAGAKEIVGVFVNGKLTNKNQSGL